MSRKKNALKIQYCQKAIWYLDSEIDLLKLTFIPTSNNSKQPKSSIYFILKPKEGLGIDGMGEFATAFESSGQFVNEKGQPVSYIQVAQILEMAFNFTFGNAYKSKERIFKRKPFVNFFIFRQEHYNLLSRNSSILYSFRRNVEFRQSSS